MSNYTPSADPTRFSAIQVGNADPSGVVEGYFIIALTAAAAIKFGDAVYIDTSGDAATSVTNSNYLNFVGFAVGGANYYNDVLFGSSSVGNIVADTNELVLVALPGSVVYGAAGDGGTTTGVRVTTDGTTAGRVELQAALSTAYTIATALETVAVAGDPVLLLVQAPVSVTT